jgi:hypothetical protein
MDDVIPPQDEIDQLLHAITAGDDYSSSFALDIDLAPINSFKNIGDFEDYLTKRKYTPEKPYGIFDKDISICRFFNSDRNENLLEDIKRKNEEQGYGNIKIPNTNIMLINYSFCPNCKSIFSFKEITEYYMNPKVDNRYKSRAHQYREDTRVYCNNCSTYFLPSLIISDGTPKNEIQFLCRVQTIDAVEKYFSQRNIRVLTKNKKNIIQKNNIKSLKNDVFIKDLENKPTLITNIVQYTPFNLIMNLIDGTNVEKGDLLFE